MTLHFSSRPNTHPHQGQRAGPSASTATCGCPTFHAASALVFSPIISQGPSWEPLRPPSPLSRAGVTFRNSMWTMSFPTQESPTTVTARTKGLSFSNRAPRGRGPNPHFQVHRPLIRHL